MKNKNRLVLFGLTFSLLLSGCSLDKTNKYQDVLQKPVILVEQQKVVYNDSILCSVMKAPSNEESKNEILDYIATLHGENQVIIYEGTSALTEVSEKKDWEVSATQDQSYSEEIFLATLKQNPMIQIYYCGSEEGQDMESSVALQYPNVTYVKNTEDVNEIISKYYRINQVTGYCITKFREGKYAIENFDLNELIEEIKNKIEGIEKQEIMEGILGFCNYIENTTLFQKGEELSDSVAQKLKPYIELLIPKVKNTWEDIKPYVNQEIDKALEFYESISPEIQTSYEKTKKKIKGLFNN